jgi:hypothetical protein
VLELEEEVANGEGAGEPVRKGNLSITFVGIGVWGIKLIEEYVDLHFCT